MKFTAGLFGLLAVALGAFGAHALKPTLLANGTYETWSTAAHYQLVHAVAILAISGLSLPTGWKLAIVRSFSIGVVLFSGSLYVLALNGPKWLGPVTPVGGLALLTGWALLITSSFSKSNAPTKSS